jgi:hypothetical protein
MSKRYPAIAAGLLTAAALASGGTLPMPTVAAEPTGKVVVFDAKAEATSFKQVSGQPPRPQTGAIFGPGVLKVTFVTISPDEVLRADDVDPATRTGTLIIRHTDRYQSKTATHPDSTGVWQPDSFNVDYTIVVVIAPPQQLRVTFIGELSDGTGVFAGATGVLSGYMNQVPSSDPAVNLALEGRGGGEIHFASSA